MKLPHPDSVIPEELAARLRGHADYMITVDGDRDHMNPSNLTCGTTQQAFYLMLVAADKLSALSATHEDGK